MQSETVKATRAVAGIDRFEFRTETPPADYVRRMVRGTLGFATSARLVMCGIGLALAIGAANLASLAVGAGNTPTGVSRQGSEPAQAPPKPLWVEVNRPIQLFDLTGSDYGRLPLSYRARRRTDNGARQDILTFGTFGKDTPYLILSVLRAGKTPIDGAPFYIDLARVTVDADLGVTRSGLPTTVQTRFGTFAVADITVAGRSAVPCLGFRLEPSGAGASPIGIAGFACGADAEPVDRRVLACVLDRIDLVSAGDDEAMRNFFVQAEQHRGRTCGASRLTAAVPRTTWLDPDGEPPLLRPSEPTGIDRATP